MSLFNDAIFPFVFLLVRTLYVEKREIISVCELFIKDIVDHFILFCILFVVKSLLSVSVSLERMFNFWSYLE